ncbi:uncharacterized protein [Prorops nasuta]|uniref:uncharacterized protein isoform X2 n=1 Tax=Prorops nasuta TaxID=863751 RepID=UPI0034CE4B4D
MEIPLREVFGVPALKSNLSATQTESGVRTSNFLPNFIKDTASVKALQEFLEDPYETLNSNIKFSMGLQIHQLDSCSFVGVSNSEQLTYNCMNRSYILAQYTETIAETSADNDCSDKVLQRYVETSDDKNLTKHEKSLLKNEKYLYDRVEKHLILKSQVEEMVYDLPLKAGQSWQFAKVMPVQIVEIYNVPVVKTTLPYSARFIELSEQLNKLSATIYKQQEEEMTIFYKNLIPILDLTKLLKDNINGLSPFEECAILRLLCIVNSLDPDLYKFDPIKYQVIRRATCDVNSFEASIINEHTMYPDCRLLVTTLHTAVNIVTGEVFSDLPEPFNRNSLDDEWTMVPVRLCMSSDTLVPYIAAFMTSRLWAGSVNLKWSMTWFDSNWEKAKTGFYYGMPRCNSVQIPGPRNVMLVIVDGDCQHIPQIMRIGNLNVDVYQKGKKAIPCDFTTIWKEFFQTKNIKRIRTTCLNAINEICNLLAVGKACGAATALAAWQPGLYTDADTENSFSNCLSGAYAYGNSSTPNTIDKHNGKVLANVWVPKETNGVKKPCVFNSSGGNKVLMGFNFASHSPLLMYASGKIDVKVKEYYEHVLDTSGKELGKLKSASLYWDYRSNCLAKYPASYRVRQASSLMRLSIAVGLISTQQPMFWNLSGTTPWIHIVALAMASQTNVMLLKNDVSLRDWMGIEINITDGLIPAKRPNDISLVSYRSSKKSMVDDFFWFAFYSCLPMGSETKHSIWRPNPYWRPNFNELQKRQLGYQSKTMQWDK